MFRFYSAGIRDCLFERQQKNEEENKCLGASLYLAKVPMINIFTDQEDLWISRSRPK